MPYRRRAVVYKPKRRVYARKLNDRQKVQVKRLIGTSEEVKAVDSFFSGQDVTAAGTITLLAHPSQGDGISQRNGDIIKLKKLVLNIHLTGADTTNVCRHIIFRWTQNNNVTAPVVTDVLQNLSAASMYNFTSEHQKKVHIVSDRTINFSSGGMNAYTIRGALWGRKLGKKKLTFNAATALGTDQFYSLVITDSVAASHPQMGGYIRMEYCDS